MEIAAQQGAPQIPQPTQAPAPQGYPVQFQQFAPQPIYGVPAQGQPQMPAPQQAPPVVQGGPAGVPQQPQQQTYTPQQIEAWRAQQAYIASQQGQQPYRPMILQTLPNGQQIFMPAPVQQPQVAQPQFQQPQTQPFVQNGQPQFQVPPTGQQMYSLELDANGVQAFAQVMESNGRKAEAGRIRTQFNLAQNTGFEVISQRNVTVGHVLWTVVAGAGLMVVWEGVRYLLKDKVALPGLIKYSTASKR